MNYPFPPSNHSRLFHGKAGGCVINFKIDDVEYQATGTNGIRGFNYNDVIIIRPDGSAVSDLLGEIKSAEKLDKNKPPKPGTYPALAGGVQIIFHDGVQWYRAITDGNAVKGFDIPDSVTVTDVDVHSMVLGHARFEKVEAIRK